MNTIARQRLDDVVSHLNAACTLILTVTGEGAARAFALAPLERLHLVEIRGELMRLDNRLLDILAEARRVGAGGPPTP